MELADLARLRRIRRRLASHHPEYRLHSLYGTGYVLLYGQDAIPIESIDALEAKMRTLPLNAA